MIVKRGNKFRVVSKKGKNLGESDTKEGAAKRLRQVEYFKHHSKSVVDSDLVKQFLPGSSRGMVSYTPVVFQTATKPSDKEGEKLDFPSTGKKMDLKDVKQPEFPSTPFTGEAYSQSFHNPRPSPSVKDESSLTVHPSSGNYQPGAYRGEHGPDTQYKGSDYVPEDVKKKARAKKSIRIAGGKVAILKGEGGDNVYLRNSYPIDKDDDRDARNDFIRKKKMEEQVKEYERAKNETPLRTPRDPKSITHDPDVAFLGRSATIKLKKGNKSIANFVLQYTQNQPLAAGFKPLVAYLIKDDDDKKKKRNESLKVTTFTGAHVGKSEGPYQAAEKGGKWPMTKEAKEHRAKESEKDINFATKQTMTKWRKPETEKSLKVGPWRSNKLDKEIDEQMAMPRKVAHDASAKRDPDIPYDSKAKHVTADPKKPLAWRVTSGNTLIDMRGEKKKWKGLTPAKKSEMPETTIAPPKKKTISPAGTIAQMIKEKMAERDKTTQKDKKEKSLIGGPFQRPDTKLDSGYGAELRKRAAEYDKKEEERKAKVKADSAKIKKDRATNVIEGGIGDNLKYKDVDEKELDEGIRVEQEHVGRNKEMDSEKKIQVAADIAMDHLEEDEKYYTKLAEMERQGKENKKEETKKKKLLREALAEKSVIKERKLTGVVQNAEKMMRIREETGASPNELKTTAGQLKAYTAKLKAEREKNKAIRKAQPQGYRADEYFKNTGKKKRAHETDEAIEVSQMGPKEQKPNEVR